MLYYGVSVHVCLIQTSWKQLHIAAPTVDVLLVFHRELHHQRLTLVAEGLKSRRQSVEPGILASLQAFIFLLVTIELAGTENKFAKIRFVLGFDPALGPPVSVQKLLLKVNGGISGGQAEKAEQQRHG